ncbi:DUF1127 domain-containing protein [Vibrio salinus]|uniref:DUF1127 domain-containing protein n=1 Tax=Vibrio salinus TaxID=2899784 RepID=UPI001E33E7E3|nr:DUF1127 domain-containing protein [Vibrio salinus]MCE0494993.1 DUF1127 domain-containing protein [Vibrio salinus]
MNTLEKYPQYGIEVRDCPSVSTGKKILRKIQSWRQNFRTRKHLKDLPDHLLEDIGIDKKSVREEVGKPFWK